MKPAWVVSVLWAVIAVGVLQTVPSGLVLVVVLFYILIGSGLPAGTALASLDELEQSAVPSWAMALLASIAASFVASAIGGQPLIWTSQWTASRHIVATMIVGMALAWAADRAITSKVAS